MSLSSTQAIMIPNRNQEPNASSKRMIKHHIISHLQAIRRLEIQKTLESAMAMNYAKSIIPISTNQAEPQVALQQNTPTNSSSISTFQVQTRNQIAQMPIPQDISIQLSKNQQQTQNSQLTSQNREQSSEDLKNQANNFKKIKSQTTNHVSILKQRQQDMLAKMRGDSQITSRSQGQQYHDSQNVNLPLNNSVVAPLELFKVLPVVAEINKIDQQEQQQQQKLLHNSQQIFQVNNNNMQKQQTQQLQHPPPQQRQQLQQQLKPQQPLLVNSNILQQHKQHPLEQKYQHPLKVLNGSDTNQRISQGEIKILKKPESNITCENNQSCPTKPPFTEETLHQNPLSQKEAKLLTTRPSLFFWKAPPLQTVSPKPAFIPNSHPKVLKTAPFPPSNSLAKLSFHRNFLLIPSKQPEQIVIDENEQENPIIIPNTQIPKKITSNTSCNIQSSINSQLNNLFLQAELLKKQIQEQDTQDALRHSENISLSEIIKSKEKKEQYVDSKQQQQLQQPQSERFRIEQQVPKPRLAIAKKNIHQQDHQQEQQQYLQQNKIIIASQNTIKPTKPLIQLKKKTKGSHRCKILDNRIFIEEELFKNLTNNINQKRKHIKSNEKYFDQEVLESKNTKKMRIQNDEQNHQQKQQQKAIKLLEYLNASANLQKQEVRKYQEMNPQPIELFNINLQQ